MDGIGFDQDFHSRYSVSKRLFQVGYHKIEWAFNFGKRKGKEKSEVSIVC